ncbi:MAG: hypothetical protein F2737_01210 [Actinobacteria bacterium]|uniref:Unannotated protein n=1 Tax=freshwater metagenome TaxID=449393 RepID=A0A6J6X0E6_9ZZZZ|nr:hypothetical protein [Actinomycetota bacterium]
MKDTNGTNLGSFVERDEPNNAILVLSADGHFREYFLSTGGYGFGGGQPAYTSNDCTGDFYVFPDSTKNPFGMITRFRTYDSGGNVTGTVDLIESDSVFVDSSQIHSVGWRVVDYYANLTNPAGERY